MKLRLVRSFFPAIFLDSVLRSTAERSGREPSSAPKRLWLSCIYQRLLKTKAYVETVFCSPDMGRTAARRGAAPFVSAQGGSREVSGLSGPD